MRVSLNLYVPTWIRYHGYGTFENADHDHVYDEIQDQLLDVSSLSKKMLDIFPESRERQFLLNLVDFTLGRTF